MTIAAPICPVCHQPAKESVSQYGVRHDCCGLSSWGGKKLVDQDTLTARQKAHEVFDILWKVYEIPRKAAYIHLAKELGLTRKQTHIGLMDKETARKVPYAAARILNKHDKGELLRPMSNGEALAKVLPYLKHRDECEPKTVLTRLCKCGLQELIVELRQEGFDLVEYDDDLFCTSDH